MIKYFEELEPAINKHGINKSEICIVGSLPFAVKNIRENNDIDIIVSKKEKEKLHSTSSYISEDVNVVYAKYGNLLGICEDEIIHNDKHHNLYKGYKVINIEAEIATKIKRDWLKDCLDIDNIVEKYRTGNIEINWDLLKYYLEVNINNKLKSKLSEYAYEKKRFLSDIINKLNDLRSGIVRKASKRTQFSFKQQIVKTIPTSSLLGIQYRGNNFDRYDIFLRYLTIVEYLDDNQGKYSEQYSTMQHKRIGSSNIGRFYDLIDSIKNEGLSSQHPITVNKEGYIIDGAHRLACALYFDIDNVYIQTINKSRPKPYNQEWFVKNDMGYLVQDLNDLKLELFIIKGIWFTVLIWPPAIKYYDKIENDLSNKYSIKYKDTIFINDINRIIRDIYKIDDIEKWKIELKINHINKSDNNGHIGLFMIEIPFPDFRYKSRSSSFLSNEVVELKSKIRNKYKNKIDHYYHDTICHIGDNQHHNQKMIEVLNCYLDRKIAE